MFDVKRGIFSIATEISVTLPAVPSDKLGKSSEAIIQSFYRMFPKEISIRVFCKPTFFNK